MKKLLFSAWVLLMGIYSYSQNNALDFNGTDQYVQVTYNAALNPTAFTVTAWVKVEGGPDTKRAVVTSQNTASDQGYSLYVNTNNKWEFWIGTSAGPITVTSTFDAADGWTNVSGTFGNGTMRLFINGLQLAEQNGLTLQPNSVNQLSIGAGGDAGTESFFNGLIDRLCIWNVELTEQQIRDTIYGGMKQDATLIAFYRMNNLYYVSGPGIWQLQDRSLAPNYTGELINMSDTDQTPSSARYGPKLALEFDGGDDFVDFSSSAYILPADSNFTQEIWAYPTHSADDEDYHFIFGCDETLPDEQRPPVIALHGENVMAAYGDGTNYNIMETTGGITLNGWNHIAVVYNSKNCIIYINGFETLRESLNDQRPYESPIKYLGKLGSSFFSGSLDEARLWSDSRSEIEIQQYNYFNIQDFPDDLERYWNMDMGAGQILPEFTSSNDGAMENFGQTPWVIATSFNAWLNVNDYDDGYWENPANWSRGTVPVQSDFVSITYTTADPQLVVSVDATVQSLFIDREKGLLITSGHQLTTIESLIFRSPVTNLGTNILSGYFTPTRSVATYTDSGITEYNGSEIQLIEVPTFNNLIINNSGDSLYSTTDSLFINGDFTLEDGKFVTPYYMSVSGDINILADTDFKIPITSDVDGGNDFTSLTANELEFDGHLNVVSNLSYNSNIFGYGSVRAAIYTPSTFKAFGLNPVEGRAVKASTWTGEENTNDWDDENNWGQKKAKYKPTDNTDVYIVPEYNVSTLQLWPEINISNAEAKTLELEGNAANLIIAAGGKLVVQGPGNSGKGGELDVKSNSSLTIDGEITVDKDLTIKDASVTFNSGGYGLILENVNVNTGGELNLEGGSELIIGGDSGGK